MPNGSVLFRIWQTVYNAEPQKYVILVYFFDPLTMKQSDRIKWKIAKSVTKTEKYLNPRKIEDLF